MLVQLYCKSKHRTILRIFTAIFLFLYILYQQTFSNVSYRRPFEWRCTCLTRTEMTRLRYFRTHRRGTSANKLRESLADHNIYMHDYFRARQIVLQ